MDFEKFPSIARLKRQCVITEKIDGTNAQIAITEDGEFYTGSRNRWITPEDDNYGFSRWAHENKESLMELGVGRHYGEWWGSGIQRRYGFAEGVKHFSLFNTGRWNEDNIPKVCKVVPILFQGEYSTTIIDQVFAELKISGSLVAPGFMYPEGIVVYHVASKTTYKMTFEHDKEGKPANKTHEG